MPDVEEYDKDMILGFEKRCSWNLSEWTSSGEIPEYYGKR